MSQGRSIIDMIRAKGTAVVATGSRGAVVVSVPTGEPGKSRQYFVQLVPVRDRKTSRTAKSETVGHATDTFPIAGSADRVTIITNAYVRSRVPVVEGLKI